MMIRPAVRTDTPWLLEQTRTFAVAAGLGWLYPQNEQEATAVLDGYIAIAERGLGVFLIAETAQQDRVGLILGVLSAHPFNPRERVLVEMLWWVRQDRRGNAAGMRLLTAFEGFAERHSAHPQLSLLHTSPDLDASLVARGYIAVERAFIRMARASLPAVNAPLVAAVEI